MTHVIQALQSLRRALREYVSHYHTERNHQGVGNELLESLAMVTQSDEPVPAGYIPVYQNTYNDWLAGRTLVKNMKPETLAKAEKFIKQTKVYPVRRQSMKDQTT